MQCYMSFSGWLVSVLVPVPVLGTGQSSRHEPLSVETTPATVLQQFSIFQVEIVDF